MARITDYSSLQSAVENMLHRSDISTYFDQLLQAGENRIYHDVLDRGKGLRAMEKSLSSIIAENELLYSGDLSNAAWTKFSGVTVTSSITLAGHTLWTVTGDGSSGRAINQISPDTIPAGGYVTLRAICSAGTSTQTAIRVENNSADGTERHLLQSINWSAGIPSLDVSTTAGGFDMYGTPQLNDLGGGVYEVILTAQNNSGAAQTCRTLLYEQYTSGSGSSETAYWGEAQVEFSAVHGEYVETTSETRPFNSIPVPSDYLLMKYLYILSNSQSYMLERKDAGWVYRNYPNQSSQQLPVYYARDNAKFIFAPYADSDYSVKGVYYSKATPLSSSNTTNWMVTDYPDIILYACLLESALFLGDQQKAQGFGSLYQQKLASAVGADKAERHSGGPMAILPG